MLALRTYYNSYLGADKARSASDRPATRDAQHPESGVLNSNENMVLCVSVVFFVIFLGGGMLDIVEIFTRRLVGSLKYSA